MDDLQDLKFVRTADVYKGGMLAGHLARDGHGGIVFSYTAEHLANDRPAVASSLPLVESAVETPAGALPPFFAGLLPEGHRLSVLRDATKTSLDDELTLLLAVGADAPGDVQVVPYGEVPNEPPTAADTSHPSELDFAALADAVDRHAIPGVQDKASASMLTTPLSLSGQRYLLKLDPPMHSHLVVNESAHLAAARSLKIPVAKHRVISDMHGRPGLLVERFDRVRDAGRTWVRLPMEDGTQVLGLTPASKYSVAAEEVATALAGICKASLVASRNLYLQFVFAWLTGNGDLHAKNLSILGSTDGVFAMSPVYDVPCTLLYGDDSLALSVSGKTKNLKARHWAEFAGSIGLPPRAASAANALALAASARVKLEDLPFSGSPLRGAMRELRFRRAELEG
ncbi:MULTISPECIES: type II toxin-antitoxin system HipA family toxin [Arthrobacter]|uniref:Type II toxin-antitoxin system HipA family toxin n=1 Tax=Arthrobacter terricola TaxID=2547396 RepID=A0A4R5KR71_9MICC|nr:MULTISPECIES: HipA domain-containing protein [Arthrobacter]MBT8160721.1 HipA domain-containing protein [Arthrobacter sp. GN70]TDF97872.1 type II toxin-antitoxin system HipA family toxin [Arthrobacter terricola]